MCCCALASRSSAGLGDSGAHQSCLPRVTAIIQHPRAHVLKATSKDATASRPRKQLCRKESSLYVQRKLVKLFWHVPKFQSHTRRRSLVSSARSPPWAPSSSSGQLLVYCRHQVKLQDSIAAARLPPAWATQRRRSPCCACLGPRGTLCWLLCGATQAT